MNHYNFIMLVLTNLTLLLSQPSTLFIANKQLKLSSGTAIATTKSIARSSGEGQIIWDDVLVLPNLPTINFQIVTKHQFGYNPEQLSSVIQGNIIVGDKFKETSPKLITSSVFNLQGEKIGYLKANVKLGNKPKQIQSSSLVSSQILLPKQSKIASILPESPLPQQKHQLKSNLLISSVIAHCDTIKGKKIHLSFKWCNSFTRTQQFSSKSGEVVFIGNYQIKCQMNQVNKDIKLDVEVIDESNGQAIAIANFFIDSLDKLNRKGTLRDNQGKELGDMFIQGKVITKMTNSRVRNAQSVLDNINTSSPKESLSNSILKSSVDLKRSIINSNNTIKFAKEVRFFGNLIDKKSNYVSYQSSSTFEFKQPQSKKFYRGASIGRGSKLDFSSQGRGRPGVGQYFLPSIWDRY